MAESPVPESPVPRSPLGPRACAATGARASPSTPPSEPPASRGRSRGDGRREGSRAPPPRGRRKTRFAIEIHSHLARVPCPPGTIPLPWPRKRSRASPRRAAARSPRGSAASAARCAACDSPAGIRRFRPTAIQPSPTPGRWATSPLKNSLGDLHTSGCPGVQPRTSHPSEFFNGLLCSKPARRALRRHANHEPRGGRHDHANDRRCRLRPELAQSPAAPSGTVESGARSGRTNVLDPARLGASPRGDSDRGSDSAGDV